jgi:GTP-binding protein
MTVTVQRAEFITSYADPAGLPRGRTPEIVLVGRSNVGKSSLVNTLAGRRNLARKSATPGKTRLLNYYLLEFRLGGRRRRLHLVDAPGYGYAKAPRSERRRFDTLMTGLLDPQRDLVAGAVQIFDSRHPARDNDLEAWDWLAEQQLPRIAVMTKTDKLSNNERARSRSAFARALGLEPLVFSAVDGSGRHELWTAMTGLLDAFTSDPDNAANLGDDHAET